MVVVQPEGQRNAPVGGIHALNLMLRQAKGLLCYGRIRDVNELEEFDMPVRLAGLIPEGGELIAVGLDEGDDDGWGGSRVQGICGSGSSDYQ